ncbi:MAG: EAL domain-containing protein [Woeseia sp.]|nr:EAL domain-containing protein [Woeseia sp.]MBT8097556.1 EAL domain-containing protein [Woeseia sp.]NNE61122.1 EAL domain-containing protein [Woeseia sp.]NNL55725.1 EAL domain-containing protein [Woeseia sp.]
MANDAGIRTYLDPGALSLFARQLTESLEDSLSVAVFDEDGELAWCGPGEEDGEYWPDGGFVENPFAADDSCVELSNGRFAFAFPLRQSRHDDPLGYVLVQTKGNERVPVAKARISVKPILDCIHKQLDIRLELSAVRRQTDSERRDMELLLKLDELQKGEDAGARVQAGLKLAAKHFDSNIAVLWMPEMNVHKAWRIKGDVSARACDALAPIFDRLVAAAKKRRRVLDTTAPSGLLKFAKIDVAHANILSSPILNDADEVSGVLALVCTEEFGRQDIRLTRVVAAKLAALVEQNIPVAEGVLSRHDLLRHIDKHLTNNPRTSRALLLIDIDKLHVINEMHGHFGGDAAISAVVEQAHIAGGVQAVVCNLSGGSVGVFLPQSDEKNAQKIAEQIREALVRHQPRYEARVIEVVASIGIAMMPAMVQDGASALNTAEVAARSAKARGGDQVVVFDDLDASVMRRREDLDQVGQLQAALIDNRFVLYAQPIVSLRDADSRPRYEILLRMIDEDGTIRSPDRFLSSAERYQMMTSIDRWVVRTATNMLSEIENVLEANLASFSINVSTQSMMDDVFPRFVEACILESGISPDTFCFEITETAIMRNLQRAQDMLNRFRKLGCRLALDDFGTGQCSFAYLKDLPVQYIKIDGSFIRDILDNPLSEAIVESVCKIATVVNARTVGEYVENDLILQRVKQAGIDFAQGYKVGRPEPLDKILKEFGTSASNPSRITLAAS